MKRSWQTKVSIPVAYQLHDQVVPLGKQFHNKPASVVPGLGACYVQNRSWCRNRFVANQSWHGRLRTSYN